jgi:serine protease Do
LNRRFFYFLEIVNYIPLKVKPFESPGIAGGLPILINNWNAMTKEKVYSIELKVAQYDPINDIALLKMCSNDLHVNIPMGLYGSADLSLVGSQIVYFGYPFGDIGLHVLKMSSSIISSKILSDRGTKQLQIDSMIHDGTCGGPVFDIGLEKLIGIIKGKQNPIGSTGVSIRIGNHELGQDTSIAYATAIEYGIELMKLEGLDV